MFRGKSNAGDTDGRIFQDERKSALLRDLPFRRIQPHGRGLRRFREFPRRRNKFCSRVCAVVVDLLPRFQGQKGYGSPQSAVEHRNVARRRHRGGGDAHFRGGGRRHQSRPVVPRRVRGRDKRRLFRRKPRRRDSHGLSRLRRRNVTA